MRQGQNLHEEAPTKGDRDPCLAWVRREQKAASKTARFGALFTQIITFSAKARIALSLRSLCSSAYYIYSYQCLRYQKTVFPITSSRHGGLHAPKGNIWAELTVDEVEELFDFLYTVPNPFNLTKN